MEKQKTNRILNCIPSQNTQNDWAYGDALNAEFTKRSEKIRETVDLREDWWKISDQGSTGSCVGWAAADGVLRWHFVKGNKISSSDLLSVRFIWMSAKETDQFTSRPTTFIEESGTSLKAALDVARNYGCVTDNILPFLNPNSLYTGSESTFYAVASKLRILNYFNLITGNQNKLESWKQWIAAGNGPILTRLNVDQTWDNAETTKGNLDIYLPNTARDGHAVAIVGYTKDCFIIRNSWGINWGDKGFAYASYSYTDNAFTEAYGVSI